MNKKINLGIIFGGRSVEHEVSILTGYQAIGAADHNKYNVHPVYLGRDNSWYTGKALGNVDFFRNEHPSLNQLKHVFPCPDPSRGKLYLVDADSGLFQRTKRVELDCVLPATHGTFVEDGALQGILEMADVPFACSGVRGSAVGMDKALTKAVLQAEGLPFVPYTVVNRGEWDDSIDRVIERFEGSLSFPVFVKPAVLGSSVAVSRASDRESLTEALDLALRFCERAEVETAVIDMTEINCAVIDGDPPVPSLLEQPVPEADLLSFDEKYKGGSKGNKGAKGMASQKKIIPAPLDDATTKRIQDMAVKTFQAIGAGGVARIDFMIGKDGSIFVNELNNIPGSLAFYLWEQMGRSFTDLIDRLVERAFEVQKRRRRTTYAFEANLLAKRG